MFPRYINTEHRLTLLDIMTGWLILCLCILATGPSAFGRQLPDVATGTVGWIIQLAKILLEDSFLTLLQVQ